MTTRLDDDLLAAYMNGFYGYGNLKHRTGLSASKKGEGPISTKSHGAFGRGTIVVETRSSLCVSFTSRQESIAAS